MRLWRWWVALLERQETGESLAAVRVLMALTVLTVLLDLSAFIEPLLLDAEQGGYRTFGSPPWLVAALGGVTPGVVSGLVSACAVSAVLLLLGVLPRLMALACLQILIALTSINGHAGGSDDLLLLNALWLLVLSDSGKTLSLTCRVQTGSWHSDRLVSAWPRHLIIGQLVVMYATTGLQKVSAHWVPGGDLGAIYYILQQPAWIRWELPWLADAYLLTQAATLGTWCFEVGAPMLLVALYFRDTRIRPGRLRALLNRLDYRTLFALAGAAMHLGIHLVMNIGPFSLITLSLYPALWHPDEWRQKLRFPRAQQ